MQTTKLWQSSISGVRHTLLWFADY